LQEYTFNINNFKGYKMKKLTLPLLLLVGLTSTAVASDNTEAMFDAKCGICHMKVMPQNTDGMIAPALSGVMRHLKMQYPNKDEAIEFMVDYVLNPSKSKAICQPQKIAQFGLMPSQKDVISQDELKEVSEWMFDNFSPANFQGRGMGNGGGNAQAKGMKGMHNKLSFSTIDINGDGYISQSEFTMAIKQKKQQKKRKNMSMKSARMFAKIDSNGDGKITMDEFDVFRAMKKGKKFN
jgi:hypothetical protein